MKSHFLLIILILSISINLFAQYNEGWVQTDSTLCITNKDLNVFDSLYINRIGLKTYIGETYHVNNDTACTNNAIFYSPVWKKQDTECAMQNTIILYDVNDLSLLLNHYGLLSNIISIDTIIGTPACFTLSVRNLSYTKIDSICNKVTSDSTFCRIAEPDYMIISKQALSNETNNPKYSYQWGLNNILDPMIDVNAPEAWTLSTGENIRVAVIDEGVDLTHVDLYDNMLPGYDCTDGNRGGINGGYADASFPNKADRHGTYCAGIIAAVNNNIGCVGVAYNSKIIPIRKAYSLFNKKKREHHWYSKVSWNIKAFRYAINTSHADVISNSWSYEEQTTILNKEIKEAVNKGRDKKGCIVVCASGNDSKDTINYPSSNIHTISVGNINETGIRKTTSNYGERLDVVAPGTLIWTTDIHDQYDNPSGTSMACPFVAGIAALMLSVNPDLTWSQVRSIIRKTAYKLTRYSFNTTYSDGTWNEEVGYGLVNAYEAVKEARRQYIQNKTYESGTSIIEYYPEIFAGYSVTTAVPYGNVVVKSGSNVTFKATDKIHLKPGFRVERGGTFHAYIEQPQANNSSAPALMRRNINSEDKASYQDNDKSIEANEKFYISPNPANTILTINSTEQLSMVIIYSLSGQPVLQTAETEISVAALPAGMYIVRAITTDGEQLQAKFIKQ